jgi:hypothetical protein
MPGDAVVTFAPAPGPLDNPLKGWCTYTDAGPIRQPYSMVYRYVSWRELEPREGDYRFAEWEKRAWEEEASRGRHVVFRVYVDYPSQPSGLPEWLRAKGVGVTRYTDEGGGESPDYAYPALVAGMERLIAALGARYDRNPRVAFVQIGLLGFWGEWHTYPRENLFAPEATQRRVIDAYRAAFPNKKLMARYARGYPGRQPWLGYHDDFFPDDTGDEQDWYFLHGIRAAGRSENWRRAAIGGEMIPQAGNNALKWIGTDAGFARTLAMTEAAHFSWVGPYSPALEAPPSPEYTRRCERLVRRMGYQFRLKTLRHPASVRRGDPLPLVLEGVNEGVAPFYYPWPVEAALLDAAGKVVARSPLAKTDVRTWQPGPFTLRDTARFPATLPTGRYRFALGIADSWTGRPAVRFANKIGERDGWAVVSGLLVTSR